MVRPTTLIHGVMGSNLVVVTVSAPQIRGLDDGASGIGQAKSRPTKLGLAPGPGEVPQSRLQLGSFH